MLLLLHRFPATAAPVRKSRLDIETFFSGIFKLLNNPVLEPDLPEDSIIFNVRNLFGLML